MAQPKGVRYGGRAKGTSNKATAEVRAFAGQYTEAAIKAIVEIAENSEDERVKLVAWKEVLDRAIGRPALAVEGDEMPNNAFQVGSS